MIFLAMACAQKAPATLFVSPPRVTGVEPSLVVEPRGDDLHRRLPMIAGEAAPNVDDKGNAEVSAVIVPRPELLELLDAKRQATSYRPALDACQDGRLLDRVHCEDRYRTCEVSRLDGEQREQGLRWAVPAAGLLGGVVTAGLLVAYEWARP